MQEEFDSTAPCLCCNNMVLIQSKLWGPYTVAICDGCFGSLSVPLIRVIFLLRCQITALQHQVKKLEEKADLLLEAQRELEQELDEQRTDEEQGNGG